MGSVNSLCVEAIRMRLMTHDIQARILAGDNDFTRSAHFLEHIALRIEVMPLALALFMNMLCGLRTRDCDKLVWKMSKF